MSLSYCMSSQLKLCTILVTNLAYIAWHFPLTYTGLSLVSPFGYAVYQWLYNGTRRRQWFVLYQLQVPESLRSALVSRYDWERACWPVTITLWWSTTWVLIPWVYTVNLVIFFVILFSLIPKMKIFTWNKNIIHEIYILIYNHFSPLILS